MMLVSHRAPAALVAIPFLAACFLLDGDGLPEASVLDRVAGTDGQTAPARSRLPSALQVEVLTDDRTAVPRAPVRWVITSGAGALLSDSLTVSDGTGRAQVVLTLGPSPGDYRARAELAERPEVAVLFTATATAIPQIAAITPNQFTGGDTITITGTGFGAGARIEVSSAPARVVTVSSSTVTAVVPVCLVPGEVSVVVRLGTARSDAFSATYVASSGPLTMAVGDYASIAPSQLSGCATFPSAGPNGAEYLISVQSVTGTPGLTASYSLIGDSVVQAVMQPALVSDEPWAVRFHDYLRRFDGEVARAPRPVGLAVGAPLMPEGDREKVGDKRTFRVCNNVECREISDFTEISAEVKYVGTNVVIYQDREAPPGGFDQADLDSLGALFDRDLYDVATRAFGAESDVDQNGRVVALLTPVVNQLTPKAECETSIIVGFFFAIDIDPSFAVDDRSNKAEVFYTVVPDPGGSVTCKLSKDGVNRVVPTVFIHELQHMVSYNQHVLLRGGPIETLWLNEALSHIAEELAGRRFLEMGDDARFSQFVIGDIANAYSYLRAPGSHFTLPAGGGGSLEERGASWLFVRWFLDNVGQETVRSLVETDLIGAENVETVADEPFARMLAQWSLANYVSDLPGFDAPDRLTFKLWAFRTTYESLHEQLPERFDLPFPLVPFQAAGGTFASQGTLRSGSGDYFLVTQSGGQRGFTLQLVNPAGGPVDDAVSPRLNVVRIR